MSSRLNLALPGVRPALPARALISGPPGAGKTWTGMTIATALSDGREIIYIDTERRSALSYADHFTFTHLDWEPPYNPVELGRTLADIKAERYGAVVLDSMSHFWRGEGGTLDTAGGKFTGWKEARKDHNLMIEAILACEVHFIGCARSKMDHVQEIENGKHVVRKVGMSVIQDDDLEYELNVALEMEMDHTATISKSRTPSLPVGQQYPAGRAEDFAIAYRDWLKGGEPLAPSAAIKDIRARVKALPTEARRECIASIKEQFGLTDHLRKSQVPAALALLDGYEAEAEEFRSSAAKLAAVPAADDFDPLPDDDAGSAA